MLAAVTHVLPLTTIRRERLLPVPGRILARMDQKVLPLDVIAEAHFGQKHAFVNVARTLGVPPDTADKLVVCKVGERIQKGQVIARRAGLIRKVVGSPHDGRVIVIGGGQILLEGGEGTFELVPRIPGIVTRLIPERGVEITVNGAWVQGVWGNGQVNIGLMLPLLSAPDEALVAARLDISLRGSVLLAGFCGEADVLRAIDDLPARGLILGSMSPFLIPVAMQVHYPIMVTDGFGHRPMNSASYKLLMANSKHEVTINAEPYDRNAGTRPEVIIPLLVSQESPAPTTVEEFSPGQQVCVRRPPHSGEVGTLVVLRPGLTALPSGLRVPVGEVLLEGGQQVIVPLANLEVLG